MMISITTLIKRLAEEIELKNVRSIFIFYQIYNDVGYLPRRLGTDKASKFSLGSRSLNIRLPLIKSEGTNPIGYI